jgi:hypothetical protein
MVVRAIAGGEICFELRHGEMFPPLRLGPGVTSFEVDGGPQSADTTKLWRDIGARFP